MKGSENYEFVWKAILSLDNDNVRSFFRKNNPAEFWWDFGSTLPDDVTIVFVKNFIDMLGNKVEYIPMLYEFYSALAGWGKTELFGRVYSKLYEIGWEVNLEFLIEHGKDSHLSDNELISFFEKYTKNEIKSFYNNIGCSDLVCEVGVCSGRMKLLKYVIGRFATKELLWDYGGGGCSLFHDICLKMSSENIQFESECIECLSMMLKMGIPIDFRLSKLEHDKGILGTNATTLSLLIFFEINKREIKENDMSAKRKSIHSICFQAIVEYLVENGADLSIPMEIEDVSLLQFMKNHKLFFSRKSVLKAME